jgi:diguanylate cyclase (GGDEF)-like protein
VTDDLGLPPLTMTGAEKLVRDLERALEAHRAWLRRFMAVLVCRTRPSRAYRAADSHLKDDFGLWYYQDGNDYLRPHPDFVAIGRYHEEMHAAARQLAVTVAAGERIAPATFRAFQRSIQRFRGRVAALVGEAQKLLRFTDPLTGLATRFAMLPKLDQERARAGRTGEAASIGMVDLDHFKAVNDTYGHNAGDLVLQDVARFLLKNVRQYDQICRYGGEEFLVLLPGTEPQRAKHVLDRLRRGLKRRRIAVGNGKTISISASFGIAALDPDQPVLATIDHADQAMYAAKQAGRNRVRIWGGDDKES